jgi:hypothetical protein
MAEKCSNDGDDNDDNNDDGNDDDEVENPYIG